MANILKSAPIIEAQKTQLKADVRELKKSGTTPSMNVILVGDSKASAIYVRNKERLCKEIGADFKLTKLSEDTDADTFLKTVKTINADPSVHGCFIQLPLPKQLQHIDVASLIDASKDVDGFHSDNIFYLFRDSNTGLQPCTPKGIISLLKYYKIDISGKHVAIIGRSLIVGKPLAMMLTNENATVTHCHSKTEELKEITKSCDIIISAVGSPKFLTSEYFKDDNSQVVIDVGMNHDENNKLCGDVDFDTVEPVVASITPVPGGVGPMTVLSLMENLIQAAK